MSSKQFDWSQDPTSLFINIPISGVSLKKIDVDITDLVLKINVKDNNFIKVFDFPAEVDCKNRENKITYNDGVLELYIKKQQPKSWDSLVVQGLSKEEIRQRREESFKRREDLQAQLQSQREDLKIKFDRHVTQEQTRLDNLQRETIEEKQRREREEAEQDLYSQLDENSAFKSTTQEKRVSDNKQVYPIRGQNNLDDDQLEDIIEDKKDKKGRPTTKKDDSKDIFDDQSVPYDDQDERGVKETPSKEEEKPLVVAEPRKAGSVQLKFTEKMYPHLAAREQHSKEPPLPKTTQIKKGEKDAETENPLWLKDKGDEFFKNGDFFSAINAYSSAYRKNNDMIECVTNRSCCYLSLFDYENCIGDCDLALEYFSKQTEPTQKHQKLKLKAFLRKGIALSWKGNLDEAKEIFDEQLKQSQQGNEVVGESERKTIEEYIQSVEKRLSLNDLKKKGDLELGKANVEEAVKIYRDILKEDPKHEIVHANLALSLLKLKDYQGTVNHCDEVLDILKPFKSTTQIDVGQGRSWNEFKIFVVKVLLRRGTALENLGKYKDALRDVDQALMFQGDNAQAKKAQYRLRTEVTRKEVESIKEEANALLKEKKIEPALEKYDECLKKIQPTDLVPYLGILLNKCICYLMTSKFEDIVSICIRGLNLISNHKQKVISFAEKSERKELNEKLRDYEIRFLVRRGNAYLKTKKFYHAKSDLEEALKLDPQNAQIKQDLNTLNEAIAEK